MSTLSAILPYFGCKRQLAPEIVAEFGPHKAYAEIFCGSLAVLLAKDEASMEIANDAYGSVVNLARVIASDRWKDLARRVARICMHEGLFTEAKAKVGVTEHLVAPSIEAVADEHVDAAVWFFTRSWMGRNGNAGTHEGNATMARRFTSNGGSGGLRWHGAIRSLGGWHERLCRVQFSQMDSIEMVERIDDSDAWVIYADPPYIEKTNKYVHDFEADDHRRLAEALSAKRRARVVVSYYDHPRLAELYPGWTVRRLAATKAMVNQGRRDKGGRVDAPEVLLINGPSLVEGGLFGATA